MLNTKINWKPAALVYGGMAVIFFFAFFYAAFNNEYEVVHNAAVAGNSNYPETYTVLISPALAFAYTWSVWRGLGLIIFLGIGLFLLLVSNDIIGTRKGTAGAWLADHVIAVTCVALLLSLVLFFSAHSNVVAGNNKVTVSADRYENIQNNKDSLKALFHKDNLQH